MKTPRQRRRMKEDDKKPAMPGTPPPEEEAAEENDMMPGKGKDREDLVEAGRRLRQHRESEIKRRGSY